MAVWRASHSTPPHSHNGFLDLLLALGTAGLAVFLVAFAVTWRRALALLYHGEGSSRTFPLVFLSLLVLYNLTESSLTGTRSLEWIVFVAVAAATAREMPARDLVPQPTSRTGGLFASPE